MVLPDAAFEPAAVLEAVEAERLHQPLRRADHVHRRARHPEFASFDLSSLRTGIMAGSPCPVEVMKQVVSEMHMDEVTICYGMTETSPVSTQTSPTTTLDQRVATGRPGPPPRRGQDRRPRSPGAPSSGAPGELLHPRLLGDARLLGRPERTAEAIDGAGWMHTGDLATMDADGYVNIVGRIKDMIIRGGENVYPREIEEFLYSHPDVADVQVIGVPDEPLRRGDHGLGQGRERRRLDAEDDPQILPGTASPTTRCPATSSSSTSSR